MKAGIVIDDWKLLIFESHLKKAGYPYEVTCGVVIIVETNDIDALKKVILAANTEAATRIHHNNSMH